MRYNIRHTTLYSYTDPVPVCHNMVHLAPRDTAAQSCREHRMAIDPNPTARAKRRDYFGNDVVDFSVFQPHDKLTATAKSIVEVEPRDAEGAMRSIPWEEARDRLAAQEDEGTMEAYEFIFDSPYVAGAPKLGDYAMKSLTPGRPLADE